MEPGKAYIIENQPIVIDPSVQVQGRVVLHSTKTTNVGSGWIDLGLGYYVSLPEQKETSEKGDTDNSPKKSKPSEPEEEEMQTLEPLMYFVETRDLDEPTCISLKIKLQPDAPNKSQLETIEDFIHRCNFCVSRFSVMGQLRNHLSRHAKTDCGRCSEKFHNHYERDWHLRRSHDEDPNFEQKIGVHYFCRCCQLSFPTKEEIFAHLGKCHQVYVERELKKQRDPSSPQYSTVAVRDRDADSIRCVYCNQSFKTSDSLAEHFRTKHMNSISECCYCSETFNRPGILRKHQKDVHGVVSNHKTPTRGKPPY
ncbi:transcription factor Ovo-like 2 [Sabethes cyaneus]|uniref:transcription factor Ovo-like 2 n=1 Tax=Sabethes cyaneus TaxID=53552 RepID=UPI00237E6790|nr:transcription factor Ovo-like 2 [Sabethes cyaneus]